MLYLTVHCPVQARAYEGANSLLAHSKAAFPKWVRALSVQAASVGLGYTGVGVEAGAEPPGYSEVCDKMFDAHGHQRWELILFPLALGDDHW